MNFDKRGEKILLGAGDGRIYEIQVPRVEDVDN
jgi:hypothetical protein